MSSPALKGVSMSMNPKSSNAVNAGVCCQKPVDWESSRGRRHVVIETLVLGREKMENQTNRIESESIATFGGSMVQSRSISQTCHRLPRGASSECTQNGLRKTTKSEVSSDSPRDSSNFIFPDIPGFLHFESTLCYKSHRKLGSCRQSDIALQVLPVVLPKSVSKIGRKTFRPTFIETRKAFIDIQPIGTNMAEYSSIMNFHIFSCLETTSAFKPSPS
ncbi:hypothetical protein QQF64_033930 [Cirrhinus molitorella]|uniref:Uncharacterized protein n=1 Tax=Cirrhinus molitorella TaxID=172907 RepID=A0ABR3MVD4_9TELE